jgi:ubiquitin-protein ligase
MIRFSCPGCKRKFNVPDNYAGKKAVCKTCKRSIVVPEAGKRDSIPEPPLARMPAPPIAKLPVRTRRLMADYRQMKELFSAEGSAIHLLETTGDPAEVYRVEFNVRGIEAVQSKEPVIREKHVAEIRLSSDYPRLAPACRLLTPIFHPNIDAASICIGDHWVAGEKLTDLVIRIAQMIAFQAYNIKSPLNGEAAMWADLNPDSFPIDARDFYPAVAV